MSSNVGRWEEGKGEEEGEEEEEEEGNERPEVVVDPPLSTGGFDNGGEQVDQVLPS